LGRRSRDEGVQNDGNRAQGKRDDEAHPDPAPEHRRVDVEIGDCHKQQRSCRKASGRETEHDQPVDVVGKMVAPAPRSLGDRGIEQVGADCDLRTDPEARDQQRCHQRAAADTGQADEKADTCASRNERQQVDCRA
jgi:hypothetical protein